MRRRLQRYFAVGLVATAVDLGLYVLLVGPLGVGPWLSAIVALAAAAAVSFFLHRAVTFRDDPFVRWVDMPLAFVGVALVAGGADLLLLASLVTATDPQTTGELLVARLPGFAAAAVIRQLAYRQVLAADVRRTQHERVARPSAPGDLRLSVVVPAYAEQERIAQTVARLRDVLDDLDGGAEVVVVDDGSPDDTAGAARAAGAGQVVVQPHNTGKGGAVRSGMLAARGRTVVFTDADLSYSPDQVLSVLARVEDGWDVVVGSRKHTETSTLVRARRVREIGGRIINAFTHALLLGQYRDTQCGLKGFRSDVARLMFNRTRIEGFAFDIEVFHLAERWRLSLEEIPVRVQNSDRSTVKVVRDAGRLVRDLFRIRRFAKQGLYDLTADERAMLLIGRARSV